MIVADSDGATNVSEGGATDAYSITLASPPTADVTVAVAPDAQVTVNPATLRFTAQGWNVPQTVTVADADNDVEMTWSLPADFPADRYWTMFEVAALPSDLGSLSLQRGWNLVGVPGSAPAAVPEDARLRGRCWQWNAATQVYEAVEEMTPFSGLWLNASEAFDLSLSR